MSFEKQKKVNNVMDNIPFLDLPAQNRALKADLMEVVSAALDTAGFIGGPQVANFEKEFAAFTDSPLAVGLANGTDALRLALIAMGIGRGDRVVTVPNTFIATTEAISQAGAMIDFVDISPDTCLMDMNRLEDMLKDRFARSPKELRPKAIVPVHLYGQCVDMDAVSSLAEHYGLLVLEDAAQAHGASYKGRNAGTLGHAAAFSFYPGKNLGACGEAGAVTTTDAGLAERITMLRDHGQKTKYNHALEGYNARLDAIQAGFLRVKLKHLSSWNAARREIAAQYDAAFLGVDWISPVKTLPHNASSHHLYVIHVDGRQQLMDYLKEHGVNTALHYPIPLHLQECYRHLGYAQGAFPHAERSAATLLSLPMFPELGRERAQRVIDAVLSFKH